MRLLEINLTDRFYEIGNAVFNVQGVSYMGNCELAYESNDDIIINKVFYSTENSIQSFTKTVLMFLANVYEFIINKKKEGKESLEKVKKQRLAIINMNNDNVANNVIKNNVRNRLLKTINQDVDNYKLKNSSKANNKPKAKYKNQLQTAINDELEPDELSVNNDFIQRISSIRQKVMKRIFK